MVIHEAPPSTRMVVELGRTSEHLVLGRSALGDGRLAPRGGGPSWTSLQSELRRAAVRRGGTRDGVTARVEVGTLALQLGGGADPATDPEMRPNTPVRVRLRHPGDDEWVTVVDENWAGLIPPGQGSAPLPPGWAYSTGGEIGGGAGVVAAGSDDPDDPNPDPAVMMIASTSGSYHGWLTYQIEGLEVGHDYEAGFWFWVNGRPPTFRAEITGLAVFDAPPPRSYWQDAVVAFTATATTHELSIYSGESAPGALTFVDDVQVWRAPGIDLGRVLYTGTLADVAVTYPKSGDAVVTPVAVDAVQSLANTPRFGAVTESGAGYEPWHDRADRIMRSAGVPWVSPTPEVNTPHIAVDTTALVVENPGLAEIVAEARRWVPEGTSVGIATDDRPVTFGLGGPPSAIRREVTGLVIGQPYRLQVWTHAEPGDEVGIEGRPNRPVADYPSRAFTTLRHDFLAGAPTHHITVTRASGTPGVTIGPWSITPLPQVMCQDVVYESMLTNHLDLVATTARAGWFVDRHNRVRIAHAMAPGAREVRARFSDVHDLEDPLHQCMVDADVSYDTRSLTNILTLDNHGRAPDGSGGFVAADRPITFTNPASVGRWGARAGSVGTCVVNIPGSVLYQSSESFLASHIMSVRHTPAPLVTRVRFNAGDERGAATAARLELYDRVSATVRGVATTARVIGLSHDITPTRWMVTVDLIERPF